MSLEIGRVVSSVEGLRREVDSGVVGRLWRRKLTAFGGRVPGEEGATFEGALPPASAQLCRCQLSHSRGFRPLRVSVAMIEKCIVAKRPLHRDPEPQ